MRKRLPFLVCLLACGLARAYDFAGLKPEGYVSDFARVVDASSRQQLEGYAKQLQEATGVQIALVTLPGLAGEPLEDVANALFRKWGIGQKGANSGLLLLLVPRERRFRLEVGYGLEEFIPALREGQYGEALLAGAHELGARIAAAKNVKLAEAPAHRQRQRTREAPVPVAAVLGGLVVFALLSGAMGVRRSRHYHGGGGWLWPSAP